MGKKDDWCSKNGIKAREEGMKKHEKKSRKAGYCFLFAASCMVFLIIGAIHASRSSNAIAISVDYADSQIPDGGKIEEGVPAYDLCQIPAYIKDPDLSTKEHEQIAKDLRIFCFDS